MSSAVRLPSIDGLCAFEAAARLGSFERAATELHITASAVSKRVATLEELLGTLLLTRGPRALSLTPRGKDYLAQVQGALQVLESIPLHRRSVQRARRLSLSALPTFARQVLMPRLGEYTASHPDVDLEIVTGVPYLDGAGVDAHLELRHGRPPPGATVLMQEAVLPVATPALLRRLALEGVADLARAPLLRCPLEPWSTWFAALGHQVAEPTVGPRLVDVGLMIEAALHDQGLALARPSLIRPALLEGRLVPAWPVAVASSQQYHLAPGTLDPVARTLADWLVQIAAEAAEEGLELLRRRCGKALQIQ